MFFLKYLLGVTILLPTSVSLTLDLNTSLYDKDVSNSVLMLNNKLSLVRGTWSLMHIIKSLIILAVFQNAPFSYTEICVE